MVHCGHRLLVQLNASTNNMSKINFGKSNILVTATNANIDTAEEDIVSVTDQTYLTNTQLSIYIDYSLGTHTSMNIRYYVRAAKDGNWYQIPIKNEATGVLTDIPSVISAASPASRVVEERPIPACLAFKVTGQGVGGANGSVTVTILQRSN